jgi:hypothetical protein
MGIILIAVILLRHSDGYHFDSCHSVKGILMGIILIVVILLRAF